MKMSTNALNSVELNVLEGVLDSYITQKTSVALSSLLGESIHHVVKQTHVEISKIGDMRKVVKEIVVCSVFLYGGGDIRLGILYTIPEQDAKQLAAKLMCIDKIDSLDDLSKSAISEVGNIMSGSFFNALSDHTGLKVELSTPDFAMTSISALLEPHASEFVCPTSDMVTEVEFTGNDSGLRLHMLIIQDYDNARKLMNPKR
ncbi:MAG TPA: chemotaxis protein CheC [Candidatus Nitrosotalea sp.]|nr:chemotaxis protein CheC [Candidatus Nitrosotalea sp.]